MHCSTKCQKKSFMIRLNEQFPAAALPSVNHFRLYRCWHYVVHPIVEWAFKFSSLFDTFRVFFPPFSFISFGRMCGKSVQTSNLWVGVSNCVAQLTPQSRRAGRCAQISIGMVKLISLASNYSADFHWITPYGQYVRMLSWLQKKNPSKINILISLQKKKSFSFSSTWKLQECGVLNCVTTSGRKGSGRWNRRKSVHRR